MTMLSDTIALKGGLDQYFETGKPAFNFYDSRIAHPYELYQHPLEYLLWITPARQQLQDQAFEVIQQPYFDLLAEYGFQPQELFDKTKMFYAMQATNPGLESVMFNDLYKIALEFSKTFSEEQIEGFKQQLYLQSLRDGFDSVPPFLQPVVEQYVRDHPEVLNTPPGTVPPAPNRGGIGLLTVLGLALTFLR